MVKNKLTLVQSREKILIVIYKRIMAREVVGPGRKKVPGQEYSPGVPDVLSFLNIAHARVTHSYNVFLSGTVEISRYSSGQSWRYCATR